MNIIIIHINIKYIFIILLEKIYSQSENYVKKHEKIEIFMRPCGPRVPYTPPHLLNLLSRYFLFFIIIYYFFYLFSLFLYKIILFFTQNYLII